ncbi:benzoate 4-monooxygenase cytochrome P450 [Bombardia bombarda]|uniref:Benzoate 4-monooxygenase cytochrome P450 n=1 Tax=Bombardia bombarda TaxID=252184 RepID=A0AA39WN56_9PEZI|nr:benzoate 4-monooxygenase cytochrome P450 [Bombardia bombarda]
MGIFRLAEYVHVDDLGLSLGIFQRLLILVVGITILAAGYHAFHQLVLHPLAKFPGPKLAALTNFPYSQSYLGGRQPWDMLKLHQRYGPVVRVSPSELSFNTSQSWSDIYGVGKEKTTCFIKSAFYDGGNFADQAHSIVSERDPEKHRQMRKFLSRAFADSSLREQEHLVSEIIDKFVDRVGQEGTVDLTHWFNLLTFDVIAKLAFGQDFRGIESGETHTWIKDVLGSMSQANTSDALSRFPRIGKLWLLFNRGWLANLIEAATRHQQYTIDLTKKRINEVTDRKDFMSYLLKDRSENSDIQLSAHASDFVIAGSETTATTLAVVFYYLCRVPAVRQRLTREIRSAFARYADINGTSAAQLPYLHAVCLEALRVCPPLPLALPREVPASGAVVDGVWVPGGTIVATNPFAACMSPSNFKDPEVFDPERWLHGNAATISSGDETELLMGRGGGGDVLDASRPFSYGPRSCLGRSLAWLEMNITIARLLFNYDVSLVNEDLDWLGQSEMHLLWKKPSMFVQFTKVV